MYSNDDKNQSVQSIYQYRNEQGVLSFSDRKPTHTEQYRTLKFDCYACKINAQVDWNTTPLNLVAYRDITRSLSQRIAIDEALIRAVIHAESAFNPTAKSSKGALGLMQLMPETARQLGVTQRNDPRQNLSGGTRYLKEQLERFEGDETLALAAYNAGPGAVTRFEGVPPYLETQRYIKRVSLLKRRYQSALQHNP